MLREVGQPVECQRVASRQSRAEAEKLRPVVADEPLTNDKKYETTQELSHQRSRYELRGRGESRDQTAN